MRVLFLPGYRYPASLREPLTCGDLRYSFNLSRALVRAGMEVSVLSRARDGDPSHATLDGVHIVRYASELNALFSTSFDMSLQRARLFRSLADQADVVIANSPLSLELLHEVPCPLVYVCSGLEDAKNYSLTISEMVQRIGLKALRDPLKKSTWRRADRVNTTAVAEAATLRRMGVHPRQITTIGPGVEIERYSPLSNSAVQELRSRLTGGALHKPLILAVGRFTPAKGLLPTLHAFAALREHLDAVLVLVGVSHSHRAGYLRSVLTCIRELGLIDAVRVEEDVPEVDLPIYYSAADVTSAFSVGYDPLPTTIIESMSCGTPVVSTDFATRHQFIAHEATGILVPEADGQAWVAWTMRLLQDAALSRRIGTAALANVREEFDMNLVAAHYIDMFRSVYE